MALSIQIPYRGDQYLAQGISGAGESIAKGIESMTANLKKAKAYRQMAIDGLGADPDEVDGMSASQLEGMMQGAALKRAQAESDAKIQEHQARVQDMMAQAAQRTETATATGGLPDVFNYIMQGRAANGGAVTGPQDNPGEDGSNPTSPNVQTRAPTIDELMAGIQHMGKTNPKVGAAMMRTFLPQIMSGGEQMPTAWKSPEGNPYVKYHNTIMPDRTPMDPSAFMGQAPDGYTAVPSGKDRVQYLKTTPTLPTEFHSTMDKIGEDIASAQATLGQPDTAFVDASGKQQAPEYIKTMKGYAQKRLTGAQSRGQKTVDRYHSTGYLSDEQKGQMYQELGLPAAAGGGKDLNAKGAAEVLPLPKTAAELQKGKRYQTAKGAATWDGTKFVSD